MENLFDSDREGEDVRKRKYKQKPHHAYKINNAHYGSLAPKLMNEMVIKTRKGSQIVYEDQGDKSQIDLLTKRHNPNKKI